MIKPSFPGIGRTALAIGLAGVLAGVGALVTSSGSPAAPDLSTVRPVVQSQSVDGACDVDGVGVNFSTEHRDAPSRYVVTDVGLTGVSPTCEGAWITVALTGPTSNDTLGSTTVPYAGSSMTLATTYEPNAADITGTAVTLDGGKTPVPTECAGLDFRTIQVGTLEGERIEGTNPGGDLIYGLDGDDEIVSLQGNDCLHGGAGADRITAGNGDNVVISGGGGGTITVGNGRNVIYLGTGADVVYMGNAGKTRIQGAEPDDLCYVVSGKKNTKVKC